MTHERTEFGSRLKEQREARSLSLVDVARATKIPEKTLLSLEEGAFEQLPADVFVRGFLRSYCRCVGLDAGDILRRWNDIMRGHGEKPEVTLTRPAPARSSAPPPPKTEEAPGAGKQEEPSLLSMLSDASRGTSRISLTVAVIILVIVATLTLSLLLRRPSHVGDGVSAVRGIAARVV